jgi:dolichol-phosphate mannosyltransferase
VTLTVLTPAFNEAQNLDLLYARLADAMAGLGVDWEWIVVDDHSRDATWDGLQRLAARDHRVRGIRLARNSGSHVAIGCALRHARGDAAVLLVADLQDPPEVIGSMLDAWRAGARIVWGVRRRHPGRSAQAGASESYYWIMRHVVGLEELPWGTDFFLIDRVVIDALGAFDERHASIFGLIAWTGFPQAEVLYDKQPRRAGASGWTLARKIKLLVDSVTAFSDLPIRLCSYAGALLLLLGLIAFVPAYLWFRSEGVQVGLALAALTFFSGVNLLAAGVVGEYVWRALDQVRGRPAYIIEETIGQ